MNIIERIKAWFTPKPQEPILAVDQIGQRYVWHTVNASSFADARDVSAFRKCKATGKTDAECFKVGDNGIGFFLESQCWRDDKNYCAIPRDIWLERWGTAKNATLRPVAVRINGKIVVGTLGDTMPWSKNIKNGAGIDLNPGFSKAFGLNPPFMVRAEWAWA